MTELKQGTWVVVTDSEKALFLRNDGDEEAPDLNVVREKEQDNPKDIDQSANRPGRMQDTGVGQRSALDDTDWHELAKERFASDLADILYKQAHRGDFDRIVIIAAAKTLGALRGETGTKLRLGCAGMGKIVNDGSLPDLQGDGAADISQKRSEIIGRMP